jgi:hypothetical protein
MSRGRIGLVVGIALAAVSSAIAQSKPAPLNQLGVDVVRLKAGRTVRGATWHRAADGALTFAVRRDWLTRSYPDWSTEIAESNQAHQETAWKEATARLEVLLANPPDAPRLTFFLRQELERLKKHVETPPPETEFLWLDIDAKTVAQFTPATWARQKVALWGWSERLADVETRDTAALTKELQKLGVKPEASPPDLSDRLPARPQTDREWSARLAIVEYTLVKPFDLQGTGDTVIPTNGGKRLDIGAVMPQLLHQQLQSVLGDLTGARPFDVPGSKNDRGWLSAATRAAKDAGVRGFRVTRVDVATEAMRCTVTSEFVAEIEPERWRTIWQTTEVADGTQARPEMEARITRDPQV